MLVNSCKTTIKSDIMLVNSCKTTIKSGIMLVNIYHQLVASIGIDVPLFNCHALSLDKLQFSLVRQIFEFQLKNSLADITAIQMAPRHSAK